MKGTASQRNVKRTGDLYIAKRRKGHPCDAHGYTSDLAF